jgi:DNA primase
VSAPVTWEDLADCEISDYRLDNMPERIPKKGDLWRFPRLRGEAPLQARVAAEAA